jgi:hypothetical protein
MRILSVAMCVVLTACLSSSPERAGSNAPSHLQVDLASLLKSLDLLPGKMRARFNTLRASSTPGDVPHYCTAYNRRLIEDDLAAGAAVNYYMTMWFMPPGADVPEALRKKAEWLNEQVHATSKEIKAALSKCPEPGK